VTRRTGAAWAALSVAAAAVLLWIGVVHGSGPDLRAASAVTLPLDRAQATAGQALALAGHCAGCHTARGGAPYAGGRPLQTPFGTVYSANLTPDPTHGIGRWTPAAFVRALREGRSADGRVLIPVCPYPNFTHVADSDLQALYHYLRTQPPVALPRPAHALRALYGQPAALAVWRAMYFRPAVDPVRPAAHDTLARGAYLVRGLGHCSACHGQRNAWGATGGALDLRGGPIPMQGWVAPALDSVHEGGVAGWPVQDVVALLQTGWAPQASVSGPMALVVKDSTQHLPVEDLRAMALFLQSLPASDRDAGGQAAAASLPPTPEQAARGAHVYEQHCATCHGAQGLGVGEGEDRMPALAGNRAVVLASPVNVVRTVLGGGYGPATAGRPRPLGMPPFATVLSDEDIAAVVSHLRSAWGHQATPVSALQVARQRGAGS
jgi:mono/diheme cytochrome c family protein